MSIDLDNVVSRILISQYPILCHISVVDNRMDGAGFRDRLFLAWSLWQGRNRRKLTQAELGVMLEKVGGEAVSQPTVSSWFKDVLPGLHDVEHLAKALECDPGWLAFGPASGAPGPDDPVRAATVPLPRPQKP